MSIRQVLFSFPMMRYYKAPSRYILSLFLLETLLMLKWLMEMLWSLLRMDRFCFRIFRQRVEALTMVNQFTRFSWHRLAWRRLSEVISSVTNYDPSYSIFRVRVFCLGDIIQGYG